MRPCTLLLLTLTACTTREPVTTAKFQKTQAPPAPPLPKVIGEVVAHGPHTHNDIALTFDACSTRDVSKYDMRITRELIAANAPATIFIGGSWAREEPEHVNELANNPLFELGNHSYSHPHMTLVSASRVKQELMDTQAELVSLTGKQPTLFRPPYGEYDDALVKAAADIGLITIEYDLASGDPDAHATKERLINWVLLKARPGSIIVMHINHTRFHTAEALPGIISGLRAKGFTLVKVSDLIGEAHEDRELIADVSMPDGGL